MFAYTLLIVLKIFLRGIILAKEIRLNYIMRAPNRTASSNPHNRKIFAKSLVKIVILRRICKSSKQIVRINLQVKKRAYYKVDIVNLFTSFLVRSNTCFHRENKNVSWQKFEGKIQKGTM